MIENIQRRLPFSAPTHNLIQTMTIRSYISLDDDTKRAYQQEDKNRVHDMLNYNRWLLGLM